ncbi:MAG: Acyl-CoA dehydrogenase [Labilithrix sp.]|nr:Acyl-CoA dehydrogenase [Labilithrix sp.]
MDVLEYLLRAQVSDRDVDDRALTDRDLKAWLDRLETCPFTVPAERALWAGFEADRLGYAFVGGYQAALERLFAWGAEAVGGSLAKPYPWPTAVSVRRSLAATEAGGAQPRAVETQLVAAESDASAGANTYRLRGAKTFATLASVAEEMLVVASRGVSEDGNGGSRNRLVLVRVRTDAAGITIEPRAPTPFAPEIPHAKVHLADVAIREDDILPGDGYDVYLKPFRTIEDTMVMAATLGHIIATARGHAFKHAVVERALPLVLAVRDIAHASPSLPEPHVALAGLFALLRQLVGDSAGEWEKTPPLLRERWLRDQPLLGVADTARQQRAAAAWRALASSR